MGQLFAKIFQSIYDSSIAEDWRVRVVFQDMLVLADADGIVDVTPEALARRTNLPLEMVREAIPKLESPDPSSRTPDNEGRRIVRLEAHRQWGWRIVNFAKYRESASKDMLRMAEADRKRAYRAKYGKHPSPTPPTQQNKIEREIKTCPRTVPEMSGTTQDTDGSSPLVSAKVGEDKREMWQLINDRKSFNKEIEEELQKTKPNQEIVAALRTEVKKTNQKIAELAPSKTTKPTTKQPKSEPRPKDPPVQQCPETAAKFREMAAAAINGSR